MIALLLTIATMLPSCPYYSVQGLTYSICPEGDSIGLYVATDSFAYKVDAVTWVRSQLDPTMGDDERLGA